MASKAVIAFLFVVISAATAGTVKQSAESDTFLRSINERRLELCDEPSGERSVSVHIFNLTNPADFINGKKLFPHIGIFEEVGPFNLKETKSRENCSVDLKGLNINFESVREVLAESSISSDLDARLNTVNIAFAHFGVFVLEAETLPTLSLRPFINQGEGYLKQNQTIRDLLADGYDISTMKKFLRDRHPINLTELQHDRFTPFSDLSYPKQFTLRSDPETFGQVETLDGRALVEQFEGSAVAPATDGSIFLGNITVETKLSFFSEDLCSVVPLVFNETTTYQSIQSFKFVLAEDALEIAARDCAPPEDYYENVNLKICFPKGGVDVKKCQQNLPYIVSLPHFLNAHSNYTQNVSGMNPNIDLHQSYFIIEPVTGNVLESSLKFQLNVNLLKFESEYLIWTNGSISIQDTIFPLFWTDKKFILAEEKLAYIRKYLEELEGSTTTDNETEDVTNSHSSSSTSMTSPTTTTVRQATPTTTVGTTPSFPDTTTTQSPPGDPAFEAILRDINDLSRIVHHFSNGLIAVAVIISVGVTVFFIYLLKLRHKTNKGYGVF